MSINEHELVELLRDEIFAARVTMDDKVPGTIPGDYFYFVELEYGNFATVTLEYEGGQNYFIYASDCDEMFEGETISVDEILDIVL